MIFTYEKDKLIAQIPTAPDSDAPRLEVFASSERAFYSKTWEVATFEFVKATDGTMSVILHHLDGKPDEVGKRQAACS